MEPKQIVRDAVETRRTALVDLSHRIHANPEVGLEETQASAWLVELLRSEGFAVTAGVADMPTAFVATYGSGALHVGFCAEYDALPGIGHACGHNIIGSASTAAGIALAQVADQLDLKVTVFGTPAEENGGGKVRMLEAGLFEGVHAAMMVHPNPFADRAVRVSLALSDLSVRYTGRAAHASSAPWDGVNAADALTVAQIAIGLLRQQLRADERVHGVTRTAGDAPNVIPQSATADYFVRAGSTERLHTLEQRVRMCLEAGALATGCKVSIEPLSPANQPLDPDRDLAALYRANAESLGRTFGEDMLDRSRGASTDMGDVTQALPAIHPTIFIDAGDASNHQPEFTAATVTPSADHALIDSAIAMAMTAVDLATDAEQKRRLLAGERRPVSF